MVSLQKLTDGSCKPRNGRIPDFNLLPANHYDPRECHMQIRLKGIVRRMSNYMIIVLLAVLFLLHREDPESWIY